MKTKLRFQRGVAVALFWPTTALLPYWLGASTEELANINHGIGRLYTTVLLVSFLGYGNAHRALAL